MIRPTLTAFALVAAAGTAAPAIAQVTGPADGEVLAGDPRPPSPPAQPSPAASAAPASSDDMAKAADATAEVAQVGPGDAPAAGAAPAAAKPSSDDIDLSALGLDPTGATAFDDKLNIYGFADIGYSAVHFSRPVVITPQDTRTFFVGNFNLYLARNLTRRARALGEVRFTFLPNGNQNADGTLTDDTATDLTNFSRAQQWGGIVIERAYLEYDVTDYLTVRIGHWLTPYGIWNIDHGSPVILATFRPYIIGEQFFPEHQTGLDLFGSRSTNGFKIGYHLTASNGRGGAEAQSDQDSKLAFGGRLEVETPWGLKLGGSYYRGRYTGLPTVPAAPPATYLEADYGGDAQFDRGPLHLQGEVLVRNRHYPAGLAPAVAGAPPPAIDTQDIGFYALVGYRTDVAWNVMPYFYYEHYEPADHSLFDKVNDENLGLNFRPAPSLVFKVQGSYVVFPAGAGLLSDNTIWEFTSQVSWVF